MIKIASFKISEEDNWMWNNDDSFYPSYFHWAKGEPNINPDYDTNYAQLEQTTNNEGELVGKWFVPPDQSDGNYICQSPKIPSGTPTPPSSTSSTSTSSTSSSTTTSSDNGDLICMDGYEDIVLNSGKCYYISTEDDLLGWDDALAACDAMMNWGYNVEYNALNTELVALTSEDENDQLFQYLYDMDIQSVWIGLSWTGKRKAF